MFDLLTKGYSVHTICVCSANKDLSGFSNTGRPDYSQATPEIHLYFLHRQLRSSVKEYTTTGVCNSLQGHGYCKTNVKAISISKVTATISNNIHDPGPLTTLQ